MPPRGFIALVRCTGTAGSADVGAVDIINCLLVKFRQELVVQVEPRYSEHLKGHISKHKLFGTKRKNPKNENQPQTNLPLSFVPPINALSQTTSIILSINPTTTPLAHSGTPPESWTMITLSPNRKTWSCKRDVTCEGLSTARRGIRSTRAFLIPEVDRLAVKLLARFSISFIVSFNNCYFSVTPEARMNLPYLMLAS